MLWLSTLSFGTCSVIPMKNWKPQSLLSASLNRCQQLVSKGNPLSLLHQACHTFQPSDLSDRVGQFAWFDFPTNCFCEKRIVAGVFEGLPLVYIFWVFLLLWHCMPPNNLVIRSRLPLRRLSEHARMILHKFYDYIKHKIDVMITLHCLC